MGRRGRSSFAGERVYFVTTSVVEHAKIFCSDWYCDILVNNIKYYQQRYQFQIYGYVIMPSHFHWIVEVDPLRGTISDIIRDIKKYTAWEIFDASKEDGRADLLRFYARNASDVPHQKRKLWTKRFDDEVIRNSEMLIAKLEYIHNNPVKAGLVEEPQEFKYSSARDYLSGEKSVLEVVTDW